MRKLFLLGLVLLAAFAYVNRQRLFLRDPLASVMRNGVAETGAQVFINASNDVLLENDHAPMYLNVIQSGKPVSAPESLQCIHYLLCFLEDKPVPPELLLPGAKVETMTAKEVRFRDSEGRAVQIKLR